MSFGTITWNQNMEKNLSYVTWIQKAIQSTQNQKTFTQTLQKILKQDNVLLFNRQQRWKFGLSSSKKRCFICFNESLLKIKNYFLFIWKAIFILETISFLYWFFGQVEKQPDQNKKTSFKNYDFKTSFTKNCHTHIVQHLTK